MIGGPLLEALNRVSFGGIIIRTDGEIYAINDCAVRILIEELDIPQKSVEGRVAQGRLVMRSLLARAQVRFALNGDNWFVVHRPQRRPVVLHTVVLPDLKLEGPHTVMILVDLDTIPVCNDSLLQEIFKLSHAEARLAVLIPGGATVTEAAAALRVKVSTVRTQLASIYAKTGTRRQAELITLVGRLSILP